MWRVFDSVKKQWSKFKEDKNYSVAELSKLLDRMITRIIAFMGLIEESILVNQGLLLYFIGLQTEQAMMNIAKCRSLLIFNREDYQQYDILESLLTSHESLNIYRYSYRSYLSLENVIQLIILDTDYAKSLTYQIKRIKKDIDRLPETEVSHATSKSREKIDRAYTKITGLQIDQLLEMDEDGMRKKLDTALAELSNLLHQTSLAISETYFNHSYQQKQLVNQKFLQ